MNQQGQPSLLARILFSLFLAIVACGMSFYVILFVTLAVSALTHQANPASTPALQGNLKHIVLPISLLLGAGVFVLSMMRWGKKRENTEAKPAEYKKTAV